MGGLLPKEIYKKNTLLKIKCEVIGIKEEVNKKIWKNINIKYFSIRNTKKILDYLEKTRIKEAYIAGYICKKRFFETERSKEDEKIIKDFTKNDLNDRNVFCILKKKLKTI